MRTKQTKNLKMNLTNRNTIQNSDYSQNFMNENTMWFYQRV